MKKLDYNKGFTYGNITITRNDYESMPSPMNTSSLSDHEMYQLAKAIYSEMYRWSDCGTAREFINLLTKKIKKIMEILKCNADFNKVYYVEFGGHLCQCKLIRTEAVDNTPVYVLNVAQKGVVRIKALRTRYFDQWYHRSEMPSILYDSVEDYRRGNPITDNYGSTSNCFNTPFIDKLFTRCKPCNCGGSTITWIWRNCKAIQQMVDMRNVSWYWDCDGFHCTLNDLIGYYRTKEECERNSSISVVTF